MSSCLNSQIHGMVESPMSLPVPKVHHSAQYVRCVCVVPPDLILLCETYCFIMQRVVSLVGLGGDLATLFTGKWQQKPPWLTI